MKSYPYYAVWNEVEIPPSATEGVFNPDWIKQKSKGFDKYDEAIEHALDCDINGMPKVYHCEWKKESAIDGLEGYDTVVQVDHFDQNGRLIRSFVKKDRD